TQENGDDAFDEMNRVPAGFNGGWIQIMGPLGRLNEFKSIETTYGAGNLQQNRWPPSNIADTPQLALSRLFMLPGAQYIDPEFSWKYAVAPSTLGFVNGSGLGPQYQSDMFVGASRTTLLNGYLFRFDFSGDRQHFAFSDPRLADLVADNTDKFDLLESESLVAGRDFGVTTDIQTAPNGNLFVVSLSNGAVYEISAHPRLFIANLDGSQETPPHATPARGVATLLLNKEQTKAIVSVRFRNLSTPQTVAHIHGPAPPGQSASPIFDLPVGNFTDFEISLTPAHVRDLKAGLWYVNVHSTAFPSGEIRGQFGLVAETSALQLDVANQDIPESANFKTINVLRLGDTSAAVTVDYATADGIANERTDYTAARGTLHFAAGESEKSFDVLITDDGFVEPAEGFVVTLSNPTGPAVLNTPINVALAILDNDTLPATNPVDDTQFFVRQHYHDFLDREPDPPGFTFWTNEINSCGANVQCREIKRINVSAAFFLSIEFRDTGYLVYRMYKTAYGNLPNSLVPLTLNEFLPDKRRIAEDLIVGAPGWEQLLESNKDRFAAEFVATSRFTTTFPTSLTPAQFVDTLLINAQITVSPAEQSSLINEFGVATTTDDAAVRARVLLRVAEHSSLVQQEFNRAFVLMQYFGYLRRNPNDSPDHNFSGYSFWLDKLNQFNGNFVQAEMVKAFITSIEYRSRFGP
ncbi:MAG TPA: CHRD domain-containing protein, partial [Pyrinomonadaceae bacterium]|nr:CHRD domain-containing protein [Pyrinomonadaceae bacterium]